MNDEYLWDRTGEADPETVRLEQLLSPLKYSGAVRPRRKVRSFWWLAAAAVFIVGLMTVPLLLRGPLTGWQLAGGHRMRAGQTIETGDAHTAKIQSDETGEITIDPGSRLRLVAASDREQRFDLQRGTIHAFIWAPPGRFVVDTPSSKTIDLGCSYTLQVSKDGNGLLTVELGWVAFERNNVESFIPAGAACVTRPDKGPGTPYFSDAPGALTNALARFDTSADVGALDAAIAAARQRDALSLWHLMVRTHGDQRARVYDRFASLVSLPREATREAVVRGDGKALDAAWDALDLGNTDWWREWKRRW
jgi:hypothetical protein